MQEVQLFVIALHQARPDVEEAGKVYDLLDGSSTFFQQEAAASLYVCYLGQACS